MKHHYDYRINPQVPSKSAVEKHKDFSALLKKYHNEPERDNRPVIRWLITAASIAALTAGFFFFFQNGQADYFERQKQHFANLDYVNPPFTEGKKEFKTEKIKSEKGGEFSGKHGSKYTVPANALTDETGKIVEGDVTIHYREMHDYVDFFVSGIPMTYDSAGKQYQFESAGMVEIFAEMEGKRLNISPENPIKVELITELSRSRDTEVPKYNIYKLSGEERNWTYQDVENIQKVEKLGLEEDKAIPVHGNYGEELSNEITSLEQALPKPVQPVKPQKANGSSFVFDFKFTKDDFLKNDQLSGAESERLFKNFEGALWQVKPGENVSASDLKKNWEDASIRPLNNQDFELTLVNKGEPFKVIVNPVISGEAYQDAMDKYDLLLAQYNEDLKNWQTEFNSRMAAIEKRFGTQTTSDERLAETGFERVRITNKFAITSFGIWNCDHPYLPEGESVNGNFVDENQHKYDNHTAYMVDKSKNTLVRFYATEGAQVRYNEKSENMIWVVTPQNQLAIFRPEEFGKIENLKEEKFTFLMDISDNPVTSEEDIRKILHF